MMDRLHVLSNNSTIVDKKHCQLKAYELQNIKLWLENKKNFEIVVVGRISYANKVEKENFPNDWRNNETL